MNLDLNPKKEVRIHIFKCSEQRSFDLKNSVRFRTVFCSQTNHGEAAAVKKSLVLSWNLSTKMKIVKCVGVKAEESLEMSKKSV